MSSQSNTDLLPSLKTPSVLYPVMGYIIFLIIILFCFIYKVPSPFKSQASNSIQETVADTLIVLFFIMLTGGICMTLLPNLKDMKGLFEQINTVTYVIIYTICLIIFFIATPDTTIDKYAYIIAPASVIIGAFIFYKGFSQNYITNFNVNYERIKMMILLFCLVTIFIVYYHLDPGGYIQQYLGYSLLLTILVTIFAFLYLLVLFTLPDSVSSSNSGTKMSNFLDNFSGFTFYSSIGFLIFLVAMTIIISTYPGGFFNDKIISGVSMIILLLICILWALMLCVNLFTGVVDNTFISSKLNVFKRSLLILFGVVTSGLLIAWIVYNIQHYAGKTGTASFILNLLLVAIVLGIIYKTFVVHLPAGNSNKNSFFSLIINIIFYIPCIFTNMFDHVGGMVSSSKSDPDTMGSLIMLVVSIGLLVAYYYTPSVFNTINIQGGKQLVNKPVYTNSMYSLGTYQELTGTDQFEYQYAISFWVFLDASQSNNKYTSLLNFGNKPNVLYNGETNTLKIIMQQKDLPNATSNKLTDFDDDGNRIIYKNENMLLQKWSNIILNYNGGILDIFLNGELVKSSVGVVPYYTLDNLTIGEEKGIHGGICNVIYFNRSLNASNLYYLYDMAKNSTPPVLNNSNETILTKNINKITSTSEKIF